MLLVVAMGCSQRPPLAPVAGTSEEAAEGDDPGFAAIERSPAPLVAGDTPSKVLLDEAIRQLRAMKSSRYRHKSKIDEATGQFDYDCSGFVAYALARVLPDALAPVPIGIKGRPRAEDFTTYFSALTENDPWIRVRTASELRPGDVIAWLRPAEVSNTNTGHMVIVYEVKGALAPAPAVTAIGGAREILLRVVDSTESPHADDVRGPDTATGLGTGTLGLVVDASDAPLGYRWKGGESAKAFATLVAIARPK
jgi:hypothetical protein